MLNSLILKSTNQKVLSNSMAWHERKHNHRVARKLFVVLYNTVSCTIILPPNPPHHADCFASVRQWHATLLCSPNFPHVTIPKVEYYTILYSTIRYYLGTARRISTDQIALVDKTPGGWGGSILNCAPPGDFI